MKRILFLAYISLWSFTGKAQVKVPAKEPEAVVNSPEESAVFPGGNSAMFQFINKNIQFPERCKTDSSFINCKVYVKFTVNENGEAANPTILRGCPNFIECDKEVIRVIKMMPKWAPAKMKGEPVKSYYTIPITFKLQ